MDAHRLTQVIERNFHESADTAPRDYLGMSQIGRCPRETYFKLTAPEPTSFALTWYNHIGYAWEDVALKWLGAEFLSTLTITRDGRLYPLEGFRQIRRELVADFDDRYRGHTDYELSDGTLVEFKSVSFDKLVKVYDSKRGTIDNTAQCQAYMRHGHFKHCILVYLARDVPWREFWALSSKQRKRSGLPQVPWYCVDVQADADHQAALDYKAQMILQALDNKRPPRCDCGYCKR